MLIVMIAYVHIIIHTGLMITGRMDTEPADNDMIIADQLISLHLDSRKTADGKCQGSYNSGILIYGRALSKINSSTDSLQELLTVFMSTLECTMNMCIIYDIYI